jgi:hypothetical protein
MIYSDEMYVEKLHIRTRWIWRNDISRPDECGGITYPDQVDVVE